MAGICAAPIKGSHLRVVAVDACGVPITGTGALTVVTKGFVQVNQEPDYEEGEEFVERNADGELCVNQKDPSSLKRLRLTVDFCDVDPVLAAYVMSARLLDTASEAVTGTGWALAEGESDNRFSVEVWQRVAGSGACDASGAQRYIYNAWPNVGNTQIGTYGVNNGRSTLSFTAETQGASTLWGDGPGATSWLPAGRTVNETGEIEHWLWNITTQGLPTEACGPTTLA
jgi:hypothetical protein